MIGAAVLGMLKILLGQQTTIDNSLILGAILVLVVLLIPQGLCASVCAMAPAGPAGASDSPGSRRANVAVAALM